MRTKLVLAVAGLALVATTALPAAAGAGGVTDDPAAEAAEKRKKRQGSNLTGRWGGTLSQDLPALDEPYETDIVFSAYKGRVLSIVASIRMLCSGSAVSDHRVVKSYRTGRGPQLSQSGGFTAKVGGAVLRGQLGKRNAAGTAQARRGDCSGRGSWTATRIRD